MKVRLISVTKPVDPDQTAEGLLAYCARVSSPHQDNPDYEKLLKYCLEHKHVSVFEMADATVEIITSRAIAQQILRHRSFSFQEFSQRYAAVTEFEAPKARRQDTKNRQNSIDDVAAYDQAWFQATQQFIHDTALAAYQKALEIGIAKESARFLLPLSTRTKLYMKGSLRSWIHYLQVRCDPSTQLEHREIANAIKEIIIEQFPTVGKLLTKEE